MTAWVSSDALMVLMKQMENNVDPDSAASVDGDGDGSKLENSGRSQITGQWLCGDLAQRRLT